MEKPPRIMRQLERAKAGDMSHAAGIVCDYVWNEFGKKYVPRLFSYDSAEDQDDIQQVYMLGVLRFIPSIDHRGNPLFHLHKRGYFAVTAHTRKGVKMASQSYLNSDTADGEEPYFQVVDGRDSPEDLVVRQYGAVQQVALLKDADKSSIASRAMAAILAGETLDPREIGFNQSLAAALEVSAQRSSQSMQKLRAAAEEVGVTND